MNRRILLSISAILLGISPAALALTIEIPVTPAYLKQDPSAFTIEAKRGKGGLIDVTITRRLDKPAYLIARFVVRNKDGDIVAASHSPGVRQGEAKYYVSLLPEFVAGSEFELDDCPFTQANGQDIPMPGGTHYVLKLKDFIPGDLLEAAPAGAEK